MTSARRALARACLSNSGKLRGRMSKTASSKKASASLGTNGPRSRRCSRTSAQMMLFATAGKGFADGSSDAAQAWFESAPRTRTADRKRPSWRALLRDGRVELVPELECLSSAELHVQRRRRRLETSSMASMATCGLQKKTASSTGLCEFKACAGVPSRKCCRAARTAVAATAGCAARSVSCPRRGSQSMAPRKCLPRCARPAGSLRCHQP
mmetsp:Transcript_33279/g.73095  ORF Transcript_33279/g.73095 Transcript_33279/m.73095 type:complete len:211 (-) Transcript_33279:640-1272(-)